MPSFKGASRTSASSRAELDSLSRGTGMQNSGSQRMQDWLSARVAATPDKAFLHIDESTYSFADVDRLVSATLALLKASGRVKAGDSVALLLPNGMPLVLSFLALLRLGAVAMPLNTRLTASEQIWQYRNCGCRLLICARDKVFAASEISDEIWAFPEIEDLSRAEIDPSSRSIDLEANWAIIHTSGTSGRPKAAALSGNNFFYSALASGFRLGVLPDDRWLCVLPLYHVGGLSIILRSLLYGTAVEMMTARRFDVEAVNRILCARPISLVSLVPTMLRRLLDAKHQPWNTALRLILLGGEATPIELANRCLEAGIPIAPSYGLSEASSQVATAIPELLQSKPGSVGKPLLFKALRIIDDVGRDLLPNRAGEILVKGGSVMRGYYNEPEATRAALRDGWLHTGDIGYLDDDGDLFVLQRRSDLIVSGGENIYPAEVESVLRDHPAVEEVVVVGVDDANWGQRAAAAVQLKPGYEISTEALIAFARERIAAYKIPREIRFVDALPRTASGKIQRGAVRGLFDE